jgi:hypothetical protein
MLASQPEVAERGVRIPMRVSVLCPLFVSAFQD